MNSIKARARQAGVLYLLLAITGAFATIYVPGAFIVAGDATATARNIATGELTYRIGIYGSLVSSIIFLFLGLSLYHLLKDVDRKQATLMVMLVAVNAAVSVVNLLNRVAPLILLSGADFLSVFTKPQLDALALGFIRLHGSVTHLEMAFWGLWLFPLGILVIKSRFFPRILGILLIAGCFAWLAESFTGFVFPAYRQTVSWVALPFYSVAEFSMIIWLLVKGAKVQEPAARASQLN